MKDNLTQKLSTTNRVEVGDAENRQYNAQLVTGDRAEQSNPPENIKKDYFVSRHPDKEYHNN